MGVPCLLLFTTVSTYRDGAFLAAAERLGVQVVQVVDAPRALAGRDAAVLAVDYRDRATLVSRVAAFAAARPVGAVLAVDDSGALAAAHAAAALGLRHNSVDAALNTRDKYRMRAALAAGGVRVPWFRLCSTADDRHALADAVPFPCVIKPLELNGSRGVMRADTPAEFVSRVARLGRLLAPLYPGTAAQPFLVEGFIPGREVALEALLDDGRLHVLALFDKPDPLDGPFFEETIYVTPARLPRDIQQAIADCAAESARALGLSNGPVHAELRVNNQGPWIIELAGRSIGGLCSQTLRFGPQASLEELIIRQALGMPLGDRAPASGAGGVMMIPIPGEGILRSYQGVEAAQAVPGVEEVAITAPIGYPLIPLPEGDSYLGFIFARGEHPAEVEAALRAAHACLQFQVAPHLALRPA